MAIIELIIINDFFSQLNADYITIS